MRLHFNCCIMFYNSQKIIIDIRHTLFVKKDYNTKLYLLLQLNKRRARNRTTLPPWVSQEMSYERWKRIGIEEETEKRKRLNDEWEEKRKDYIRMKLERKQHGQTRKKIVVQEIFR